MEGHAMFSAFLQYLKKCCIIIMPEVPQKKSFEKKIFLNMNHHGSFCKTVMALQQF